MSGSAVQEARRLDAKTALVTGASRGIGREIAKRLAGEGALTAVHYARNAAAAEETAASIERAGGRAFTVRAEFGTDGDVETLFDALEKGLKEHAGKVELDILVNNAGIITSGLAPEEITPGHFDQVMTVNARTPLFIVQRALALIPDGGRIVNISSGLTRFANPKEVSYAMSKAALEMIGLHFARYLGPRGITVNNVAPGIIDTGHPVLANKELREALARLSAFGRIGEPVDVADVVAFLASDDARWITGAYIDASGGALLG